MDTSAARKAIFSRIRHAQRRAADTTEAERATAAQYLAHHPPGPRPVIDSDLPARFREQAIRMSDTIDEAASLTAVPHTVARFLDANGLGRRVSAWATLEELDWGGAGIEAAFRAPRDQDLVGVTGAFCAVAETGTLVLLSGPRTWASASLLPETHIAIVPQSRIVASMEDAFALLRSEQGELPRAVNFISGPSRTGDIEQTIVLGAHGPYRVHVIVVRDQ